MKLLALDTSTDTMSLAVQHGDKVLTHTAQGGSATSATLIPAIQALMAQAGLQFAQLDAIVFGRGPGSFTGLRTACAVTQGLAFAANVRVLPINTLQALAQQAFNQLATAGASSPPQAVCAALDARMGEVYYGYYNFDSCLSSKYLDYLPKSPLNMVLLEGLGSFVLAGNVRPTYDAQLPAALLAAPYLSCAPTASAMLQLAPSLIAAGGLVDAQDALPLYMRDKVAQTTAEREGALPGVAPGVAPAMTSSITPAAKQP